MTVSRRTFLASSATIGGALTLGLPSLSHAFEPSPTAGARELPRTAAPLRILILGGTGFIGPNQVQYALDRGHKV
ncbi:MAG TPA: twin-arginine translocation signal domain-containing protein, partial [Gemmatimonadaceae bacterium]|nr:twin-arginine translocation signal domain-containing protein [Gemmatimonadaceae bacterium]